MFFYFTVDCGGKKSDWLYVAKLLGEHNVKCKNCVSSPNSANLDYFSSFSFQKCKKDNISLLLVQFIFWGIRIEPEYITISSRKSPSSVLMEDLELKKMIEFEANHEIIFPISEKTHPILLFNQAQHSPIPLLLIVWK